MDIFPAIDLKNGQCVRLMQGDFDTATIYEPNPFLQINKFAKAGATWLHIVDLDGARDGKMQQFDLIADLAKQTSLKIQAGGGIRSAETIENLLEAGIQRVVIGSLAVKDKLLVREWLRIFGPQHVTLAFDIKFNATEPEVLTHGWQTGSHQLLWDILDAYEDSGLQNILCTDVNKDGMLKGVNNELYTAIQKYLPHLHMLASGGVSKLDDLIELAKQKVAGTIVGKAIYEGRINLAEAIERVKNVG